MINRRRFIKTTAGSAMLGCFTATLTGMARQKQNGKIEKRALGKTGERLSMIGLGGVVVMGVTAEQASGYVVKAIDMGVNYFDVAPTYGNAEDMLGPALERYRNGVFLACTLSPRWRTRRRFSAPGEHWKHSWRRRRPEKHGSLDSRLTQLKPPRS